MVVGCILVLVVQCRLVVVVGCRDGSGSGGVCWW